MPNNEADGTSLKSRLLTEKVRDVHQTQTADLDEVADMRGRPPQDSAIVDAQTHNIIRNQSLATANQFNHALALPYAGSAQDQDADPRDLNEGTVDLRLVFLRLAHERSPAAFAGSTNAAYATDQSS